MAASNGAADTPAAVVAEGLRKHYTLGELAGLRQMVSRILRRPDVSSAGLEALSSVDFVIRRGDAFGIVGTNGSGKSTLLQILAGTTLPTGGQMEIHGQVLPLLAVGTGFHPELTGRENVRLFGSTLGIPRSVIQSRMEAVADFAEIERHMDTPVKRYSSGMVSRLSFSIAMQFPADIYIFDEVLAVVDGEFQSRCINAINRLHHEGRTVIFVSHSADQVSQVCNRVLWLEQGEVERDGATAEVLDAYQRKHGSSAG
jgi:ABC-type polysaccharide/polyol phosphate transport system ATPase subunit